MRSSGSSARLLILSSAAATGALILYHFEPTTAGFYPQCVFRALTDLECPGCGVTRAAHRLLHGDFAGAFRLNAMVFVAVPFMAMVALSRRFATHPLTGWIALTATVAWWVGRNLY